MDGRERVCGDAVILSLGNAGGGMPITSKGTQPYHGVGQQKIIG